eukprot:5347747-Amphidinium_carterae.1
MCAYLSSTSVQLGVMSDSAHNAQQCVFVATIDDKVWWRSREFMDREEAGRLQQLDVETFPETCGVVTRVH